MEWSPKETWLHQINPSLKLLVIISLFTVMLLIDDLNYLFSFTIAVLLLFILFTGHPFKRILLFSIPFFVVFVSTSFTMILFGKGETTILKFGLIHITEESFYRGLLVGLRALATAALGLTFALTTKPVLLFYSLMQQMKLRPAYAYSFMAAMRMLPIMAEEFQTIRHARKVRGWEGKKGAGGFFRKISAYSIPLLSQSIRRAHRIAVAMEAKRFRMAGQRTYYYQTGFSWNDVLFIGYFLVVLAAGYYFSAEWPYFKQVNF
ncbi:energy-coupling factor transporter transmembrane protein EcfT [Mesobacillus zeae]|uniref:Energy-coupling factor transporter transmembrane protein EcfT n=1 Tax=Mesobacillus zeae TaxID=1917180 RepID=A0A398BII2_9BACI|nr:energy-coupling factor transporter transmembrane protein EcfT [Mesobacillus zeae]